jgi:hypothetical protein
MRKRNAKAVTSKRIRIYAVPEITVFGASMKKKIAQSDKKLHKNKCREWERETKTLQTASKTEA